MIEKSKTAEISRLIRRAGSDRKAAEVIGSVRGATPVHSALVRARQGKGTEYTVQCYIDDLKKGLGES